MLTMLRFFEVLRDSTSSGEELFLQSVHDVNATRKFLVVSESERESETGTSNMRERKKARHFNECKKGKEERER